MRTFDIYIGSVVVPQKNNQNIIECEIVVFFKRFGSGILLVWLRSDQKLKRNDLTRKRTGL